MCRQSRKEVRELDMQKIELGGKVLGLAKIARGLGPGNCAGMLITGYLRQAETQGLISSDEMEEIVTAWDELRQQIEDKRPMGVTDDGLNHLSSRLQSLHAA